MNSGLPPRMMSVPRPAMLVAIVTPPLRPAWATISASRSWYLAFRTWCGMPCRSSISEICSDFSIDVVPTRIGRPVSWTSRISSRIALILLAVGPVDDVGVAVPGQRPVGRDRDHVELVDLVELVRLGHGRAGHARELLVELEEVLERDRGERLVLFLDLDPLLGLDRLVQAVGPLAAGHQPAGELVDDHDLAVQLTT